MLTLGDHASRDELIGAASRHPWQLPGEPRIGAPRLVPGGLVSRPTVRAFNEVWFRKAPRSRHGDLQRISSFFHPLDGVAGWNRLYGRAGLVQYQFVVPDAAERALPEILGLIAKAGHPSFLAVLKRFGPGNPGLFVVSHPGVDACLGHADQPRTAARCLTNSTDVSWRRAGVSTWRRTPGCLPPRSRRCTQGWMTSAVSGTGSTQQAGSSQICLAACPCDIVQAIRPCKE